MSQNWKSDTYASSNAGVTDLQSIENNFQCIKSSFSGATEPVIVSTYEAGTLWFDTTEKILKVRNAANDGWLGIMAGAADYKMWVYINAAGDGWTIDATVVDRVLSVKGGTQAYNTTGGSGAGTWTQPNHTHTFTSDLAGDHIHQVRKYNAGNSGQIYDVDGILRNIAWSNIGTSSYTYDIETDRSYDPPGGDPIVYRRSDNKSWYSEETGEHDHGGTNDDAATAATYRPLAAVGTLQYPNI